MPRGSWEKAYGWARAAGVIGSSFLSSRRARLYEARGIRELYREVFQRDAPELPEPALISLAERELSARLQSRLGGVCRCSSAEGRFLAAALRRYEFENAKNLYLSARSGREAPALQRLQTSPDMDPSAFPDIGAMFRHGRFSWLAERREREADLQAANRLDRQFYEELWTGARALPRSERAAVKDLVLEEAILMNCAWAIRLQGHFGMKAEEMEGLLIDLPGTFSTRAALRAAAIAPQDREAWRSWRHGALAMEAGEEGGAGLPWSLDPRRFEDAVMRVLRRRFKRAFHRRPGSVASFYAFTRIMEFELDDLQSAFEGYRMALSAAEMRSFLEARA